MLPRALLDLAATTLDAARRQGVLLATAESCTGGLIAGCLTEIPGSSDVVDRGFVTYSNEAKREMLGVPADLLERVGAVSEEVARAMAEGALAHSRATMSVSVTGVAGPSGGSAEKPVGLVHFGLARRDGPTQHAVHRFGEIGRDRIRQDSVRVALEMLLDELRD